LPPTHQFDGDQEAELQTQPNPTRADACTPLQAIFHGAPLAECLSADFKKRTLTFKLEGHHQPAGGAYFLVPQVVAQVSIDQERTESAHSAAFLPPGQLTSLHFRARNDLALLITGENGFEHTLYRRRPSVTDQYPEPDHWSGHLSRQDAEGNKWSRWSGSYVTDNFGELVQVPA
jgi:hypothetical protein